MFLILLLACGKFFIAAIGYFREQSRCSTRSGHLDQFSIHPLHPILWLSRWFRCDCLMISDWLGPMRPKLLYFCPRAARIQMQDALIERFCPILKDPSRTKILSPHSFTHLSYTYHLLFKIMRVQAKNKINSLLYLQFRVHWALIDSFKVYLRLNIIAENKSISVRR